MLMAVWRKAVVPPGVDPRSRRGVAFPSTHCEGMSLARTEYLASRPRRGLLGGLEPRRIGARRLQAVPAQPDPGRRLWHRTAALALTRGRLRHRRLRCVGRHDRALPQTDTRGDTMDVAVAPARPAAALRVNRLQWRPRAR